MRRSLATLVTEDIVGLVFGLGMRFGNSRPYSADVNFVSGGWWLPTGFRLALDTEAALRGHEIANWMRQHPREVDALAQPDRAKFFALSAHWGLPTY